MAPQSISIQEVASERTNTHREHWSKLSISQVRLCLSLPQTASVALKQLSSTINLCRLRCGRTVMVEVNEHGLHLWFRLYFLNGRKAGMISTVHKNCSNVTGSDKAIIYICLSSLFPFFLSCWYLFWLLWKVLDFIRDEKKAEWAVPPK